MFSPVPFDDNFDLEAERLKAEARERAIAPLVLAQNDFSSRLLSHLEENNKDYQNVLVSPLSLWRGLTLAQCGAIGETKRQLRALLALPDGSDEEIGKNNLVQHEFITLSNDGEFSVVNSVWLDESFNPNSAFVELARSYFSAGVERFASAEPIGSAQKVNDWVSKHTQGEISHVVEPRDVRDQSVLLINTIFFRAKWMSPFDINNTKPAPFYLAAGGTMTVQMMHGKTTHPYWEGDSFEGAKLEYRSLLHSLWVLLPDSGNTPCDVLRELGTENRWNKGIRTMECYHKEVFVSLPRFEVEWKDDLVEQLAEMGAPLPFSPGANFGDMGEPTAGISRVIHACKMYVDEEGTVAAAASDMGITKSAQRVEPRRLIFDRPFVVVLMDEATGSRLFQGIIYNPGTPKKSTQSRQQKSRLPLIGNILNKLQSKRV